MFRLYWALKCFSTKAPIQIALQKSIFLYKFNQAESLNHFFKEITLPNTSLAQQIYALKLIIENRHPHSFSPQLKIDIIVLIRKICTQTSTFDPISIVEFFNLAMELDKRSDHWYNFKLAMNDWKALKSKIIENINSDLYQKKEFISLFRSWAYFNTKIFEVENKIREIIKDKSIILDLEECMMLLEGLLDSKIKSYYVLTRDVLRRVNQARELDPKNAAKILELISCLTKIPLFHNEIQQYLNKIKSFISLWKKEEVLSVIKFYNKGEWEDLVLLEISVQKILSLMRYDQFHIKFLLNVYLELTEKEKYFTLLSELIEIVKTEIIAKMRTEMMDSGDLLTLMKSMSNVSEEVGELLKNRIENCKWLYFGHKFNVINKISHIFITKNEASIPLTDIIPIEALLNDNATSLTRKYIDIKLEILSEILHTREDLQVKLEKWKTIILNELDDIGKSDDKTRKFIIDVAEMEIPENILPYLKPIYLKILDYCDRQSNKTESAYILKDSLKLCKSDPAAWKEFYEKNSYIFQYHHIENGLKIKDLPYDIKNLLYSKLQKRIKR
ncbi:unnamed protein product [Blepharisma stoltei]|uniref:Uncharacterized protein n=1 Tax=Blepharisma stoltei TaxID=1481888 RepID=A0AAU9IE25_9CILI|nr:unnamed protein product [Blepharisma stoltei]